MEDSPELQGGVALVTGGTSGIGRETARALAARGAHVVVVGHDRTRGERVVADLARETDNDGFTLLCYDLSSQTDVRALATEFRGRFDRLDVLVCNAGTFRDERELTEDGIEATFAVNHLSHYLLVHELTEPLVASPPSRVVVVSSSLHERGRIRFDDLSFEHGPFDGKRAYAQSKLANVMFTYELSRRLRGTGVTVNAAHPGIVPGSRLTRHSSPIRRLLFGLLSLIPGMTNSVEEGAETSVYLATADEVADVTGEYFADCERVESSPASYDEDAQRRLWERSADLVGTDPELQVGPTTEAEGPP